ncbi:Phosphotransferase enzyme family protein [Laceyella tengchongensis]|uniref:Phosphotransferase enzyme family protein n=1 Tax=Laceyella tengchongensis TaxID=574699 RepID=A0AA45WNH6_9BACL|nr:phosphotransferase family protein [Laceyella tengchongensis]SMP18691.1 Phosphotransferase enzyme family protein [Laceyella tengchongensis]
MVPVTTNEQWAQLIKHIDPHGKWVRAWELKGGVSAQVTALEMVGADGQKRKIVVRRHGEADLAQNPHAARDEFHLLQVLHALGLPVPTPLHIEESSGIFPTPCIAIEYIEGRTELSPADLTDYLNQFTAALAQIHRVDYVRQDITFLPDQSAIYRQTLRRQPSCLDESKVERCIWDTLTSIWPLPQHNEPVLLHGDFWPGNILWHEQRLVAIIDWEDAAVGDPLADVANSRLELLWAFGHDAMNHFTHQYRAMMPAVDFTNLPYWDLCAALRPAHSMAHWGLDARTEKSMRSKLNEFVKLAFDQLDETIGGSK